MNFIIILGANTGSTELERAFSIMTSWFTGVIGITVAVLALVMAIVSFMLNSDDNLSPVLRGLIKIVFMSTLLTGGVNIMLWLFPETTLLP